MSKWDKLLEKIGSLSKDMRFDELRKVLESYGYRMSQPKGGSSHCTFRKEGCRPVTIPKHEPIKKVAKKEWILAALEEGQEIPMLDGLNDYSGQFKLRIPKSLYRHLSEQSKREGISMNQYCLYLLSRNDAIHSQG